MQDNDALDLVARAQFLEDNRAKRERLGLPSKPVEPGFSLFNGYDAPGKAPVRDPIVQIVEDAGHEDFGFVLFRTDFSDEAKWDQWEEGFIKLIDGSLGKRTGHERITEGLVVPIDMDDELSGTTWEGVQE